MGLTARIIVTLLLCAAVTAAGAKEVARNRQTGMSLDNTMGIWSLKSGSGIIPIGSAEKARDLMYEISGSFVKEKINKTLGTGEDRFTILSDETGMYAVRIGIGLVKIRPSDAAVFLPVLEKEIIKDKIGNTLKKLKK